MASSSFIGCNRCIQLRLWRRWFELRMVMMSSGAALISERRFSSAGGAAQLSLLSQPRFRTVSLCRKEASVGEKARAPATPHPPLANPTPSTTLIESRLQCNCKATHVSCYSDRLDLIFFIIVIRNNHNFFFQSRGSLTKFNFPPIKIWMNCGVFAACLTAPQLKAAAASRLSVGSVHMFERRLKETKLTTEMRRPRGAP